MNLDKIIEILAPCGLNCKKCVAYAEGDIQRSSKELQQLLGSFDTYAERYSNVYPVYEDYPPFKRMLHYFTEPQCEGCRNGHCLYQNCGVATCENISSGKMKFCFECNEFPCEKSGFHPDLKRRWIERNTRMKEITAEAYYNESKDTPRYV